LQGASLFELFCLTMSLLLSIERIMRTRYTESLPNIMKNSDI